MKVVLFYDKDILMLCIERDFKLYKVYDMLKLFFFFVRLMVFSNEVFKEVGINVV